MLASSHKWIYNNPPADAVSVIASGLRVSNPVAVTIANRGVHDLEQARHYIYPSANALHDPFIMDGMTAAVDRIEKAVKNGERILIAGDYDVDGITATALLVSFLESLKARAQYYIPDREKEGYGLSVATIDRSKAAGYALIVTVDSGISAIEEAAHARRVGIDIIITDHHEPSESLPDASAVIDPKQNNSRYPFRDLAGVGVAFKLACALGTRFGVTAEQLLDRYSAFVTLGTIGDIAPLIDENRVFVNHGLQNLRANRSHPGLAALIEVARIGERDRIDTWNVSFGLVPRINAAGRVWKPRAGVELLLATDPARAANIAGALDKANKDRMDEEAEIFEEADALIHKNKVSKDPIIVLAAPDWHVGVIGIVASRIMERYGRPVALLSSSHREEDAVHPEKGRVYQGSARSIQGFDLLDAIRRCDDLLIAYGGHAMAAGLRLYENDIPALRERLIVSSRDTFAAGFRPNLYIDCVLPFSKINLDLIQEFRCVEPCGVGNPRPVFASHGVTVIEARPCGAGGKHAQLKLGHGTVILDAICFNGSDKWKADALRNESIDVVFTLKEDNYQNRKAVKLNILDLRSAENGDAAE